MSKHSSQPDIMGSNSIGHDKAKVCDVGPGEISGPRVPECVVCVPSELASALHLDHSRVKVCVLASALRLERLPSDGVVSIGWQLDECAGGHAGHW